MRNDRIDKIKRDVVDFEQVVAALVADIAADLTGQPAEEAVLALERRLDEAERIRQDRKHKNGEVNGLTKEIGELNQKREEMAISVSHLRQAVGATTIEVLKEAIEKSDQKRSLEQERQQIIRKLGQDGDGKTLEELETECKSVGVDEIVAREDSINTMLEDLRHRQTEAAEHRSVARDAFNAIGADAAAARAEADRQEALAELQRVAERYIRVKTSATLLQWAIDRYRREKPGPLAKAGQRVVRNYDSGSDCSLACRLPLTIRTHRI